MISSIRPRDAAARLSRTEELADVFPLDDLLPYCTHPLHAGTRRRATTHRRRSVMRHHLPPDLAAEVLR